MPQEEEIMAIKVSENGRLFTIQTKDSSYQMIADDKMCFCISTMEKKSVRKIFPV